MMTITESAVAELKSLLASKGLGEDSGLRIGISKGGCAGLQYDMNLGGIQAGDLMAERDSVRVFVAADAARLLSGASLDYVDDLAGAGFRIVNPNAVRSCGCGTSFEPGEAAVGT
ncbi:MAG TPA: iron-sulfur cluster assembly accessory protein [Chthoniobacterales bacterium]|jgi:iron-sulfur cluster assembly protein